MSVLLPGIISLILDLLIFLVILGAINPLGLTFVFCSFLRTPSYFESHMLWRKGQGRVEGRRILACFLHLAPSSDMCIHSVALFLQKLSSSRKGRSPGRQGRRSLLWALLILTRDVSLSNHQPQGERKVNPFAWPLTFLLLILKLTSSASGCLVLILDV